MLSAYVFTPNFHSKRTIALFHHFLLQIAHIAKTLQETL